MRPKKRRVQHTISINFRKLCIYRFMCVHACVRRACMRAFVCAYVYMFAHVFM